MEIPRHRYLDPAQVEFDLGGAARRDPIGHRLHILFGCLWCFAVAWPSTPMEIASAPLVVYFILRTPNIWRTWGSFAVQPLSILIAGWVVWQAMSLAWSSDPRQGLRELAANRWVWVMWMLWPVMERRAWFIGALAAGFLVGNCSQVLNAIGHRWEIAWLEWHRFADRNSGWWDPVVGGSLLVGALGLHLPAAIMGRGRVRLLAAAGCLVTLAAIFATGTRGAWLAAAGLVVTTLIIAASQVRLGRRFAATIGLGVLLLGIGGALAWAVAGDAIRSRAQRATAEVQRALEGDYDSDTGTRILMARVALDSWRHNPIGGIGAGSFRTSMAAYAKDRGLDTPKLRLHSHAHNALLHIAATTGIVGLLLAMAIIVVAIFGAFAELGPGGFGSYAAGPAFALIGLLLVSLFDPVHLNAQTGAMLGSLMAMSLVARRKLPTQQTRNAAHGP